MTNTAIQAEPMPFDGTIVALGASAGGLEALDRFFTAFEARGDATFVVIQHLAPEHTTMMDTLLGRHTAMTVTVATDGVPLAGNHVFVIPPGTTMTVRDHRLHLAARPISGIALPIDTFFVSLAEEAPERSIAVVLSGTGSDGTRGVLALDAAGAWVLVQDPDTAAFDGMPTSAIATGVVDHVLAPADLAAEVARLVDGRGTAPAGARQIDFDGEGVEAVIRSIGNAARLDLSQYKPTTMQRRITRRVQATGSASLAAYAAIVRTDPSEPDVLRRELLIPVTNFFRDSEAFAALDAALVDAIATRCEAGDREPFRVWVAATSTGQEAYSIAMLVSERLAEHAPDIELKLFATDVEPTYLDRAGAGIYHESEVAGISPERRERWLEPMAGAQWRIVPSLRQRIVFTAHDVLYDAPFTHVDLVTCRNMLIYLRPTAQARVIRRLTFALRPGGMLLLGTSETPSTTVDDYDVVDPRQKLYRLRRRPAPLMPDDLLSSFSRRPERPSQRPVAERVGTRAPIQRALDLVLREYVPPSLLITDRRELVHVFGDVSSLLRIRPGSASLDVLGLLPPPLAATVAALVHGALRERLPQRSRSAASFPLAEAAQMVHVSVIPIEHEGRIDHLVVSFETAAAASPAPLGDLELDELRGRQIHDLEHELSLTRTNLQETIQELGATNEELQATNEELMASNEELQSTNEELQSVNEELHTVNAERQETIRQLNDINADLESLTRATRIPLVFVDDELRLTRFTPAAGTLFRFRPGDLGRPITDFRHRLDYPDLFEVVARTLGSSTPEQREVIDDAGQSWLVTVLPYGAAADIARAVITCIDVSSVHDARRLQDTLDALPERVAVLDQAGRITLANTAWRGFRERAGDTALVAAEVGTDYLAACARATEHPASRALLHGLQAVLDRRELHFTTRYRRDDEHGGRWFAVQATPLTGGGCVVAHFDLTPWLDAERVERPEPDRG